MDRRARVELHVLQSAGLDEHCLPGQTRCPTWLGLWHCFEKLRSGNKPDFSYDTERRKGLPGRASRVSRGATRAQAQQSRRVSADKSSEIFRLVKTARRLRSVGPAFRVGREL